MASLPPQGREDSAFILVERHLGLRHSGAPAAAETEVFENVGAVAHQSCTVSEERVRACRCFGKNAPGNDEDLPSLVGGERGGDEGATAQWRLDDDRPERHAGDDSVPSWKILRVRLCT